MKLILIRHSQSLVNPNIPIPSWGLSDKGMMLAKQLNGHRVLKDLEILYSSLQTKALETAILATKNTGIFIKTDDRLTEITSFTNKFESDFQKYRQNTKDFYSGKITRMNEGETVQEALGRFNKIVEEIIAAEKDKETIGIVSHGNILAYFSAQYRNANPFQLVESIKQPDVAILDWKTKKFITFFGDNLFE